MPRGVEQEPQRKPLDELRSRLDRFNHASFKVDSMIKDPGGEPWPKGLNLNEIPDGEHYLETAVRVGEITKRLKIKTQPILEQKRYAVYSEIGDRISQAERNVKKVAELADLGIFGARGEEILKRAQSAMKDLKKETHPEGTGRSVQFISTEGLRREPEKRTKTKDIGGDEGELYEVFLRGIEQYLQDYPAPYNMDDLAFVTGRNRSGLSKNKSLVEDAKSFGIELKRGKGRKNKLSSEEFRQLAIKIGSPNPRMSKAARRTKPGLEVEPVFDHVFVPGETEDDKREEKQIIQTYIDTNPQYFYSAKDLYRAVGRSNGSLKPKQLEAIMGRHGIIPSNKRTHKYRIRPSQFMEIALDIGFPRISKSHTHPAQGVQREENGQQGYVQPRTDVIAEKGVVLPGELPERVDGEEATPQKHRHFLKLVALKVPYQSEEERKEREKRINEKEEEKIDRAERDFKVLVSEAIVTHISIGAFWELDGDIAKFLARHLSNGTRFDLLEGVDRQQQLKEILMDSLIEIITEFSNPDTIRSIEFGQVLCNGREKKIMGALKQLIDSGKGAGYIARSACAHFSIPIPDEYKNGQSVLDLSRDTGKDSEQDGTARKRGRGTSWDNSGRGRCAPYTPTQAGFVRPRKGQAGQKR